MALEQYVKKRDFSKTSEPASGKSNDKKVLRFVIQKHAASHLHYDFRLEMEGVLKSWAIPKGPSTDPKVKRLAMMVEDHPFDYRTFEGIIPKGQYGGGTVIVWDEGTYEADGLEGKSKKEQEKHLLESLEKGSIKFTLHGEKLKGSYALVKTHGRGENSWLLIKHRDEFASEEDITQNDRSVQSGKTLDEVTATSNNIWVSNKQKKKPEEVIAEKIKTPVLEFRQESKDALKKAKKSKIPSGIKPMLATLVDAPFNDPGWVYEVKWDGYRCLAFIHEGEVELWSRNNKSFNEKFYPIFNHLKTWKTNVVLDGEIAVLNSKGVSDFSSLQNWRSEADGQLVFYVFDILWFEGKNLMDLNLSERQSILKDILPPDDDQVRLSEVFATSGKEFFGAAAEMGLEGIIAKKADSKYLPDIRSKEWLKIKVHKRQEVVIGGFTQNEGSSKLFSSLLLGVYENGIFQYVGKVGTGFTDKLQKEMMRRFKPLIMDQCPFQSEPDYNKPSRFRPNPPKANATWLKPELVCEIYFSEVTNDGVFRHPSFAGMREDKKAKDVVREVAVHTEEAVGGIENEKENESGKQKQKESVGGEVRKDSVQRDIVRAPKDLSRKTLLNPTEATQVKKISGHELKFNNLNKLYWPEDGVSKRDMFNYYYQVAEYILPYLKDRPQSLNRFPNGIHGPSFYQKDVKGKAPEWAKTFPYTTSDGEDKEYLVIKDEASLLWMVSLGCIEINPWFSRIQSPDNPDYCVIDLDPDKNTFEQVIQAAQEVKKVLDELDVPSYVKTSGSTGIHIYIPLGAKYTYDQSQLFARLIVNIVHRRIPEFTSLERMVSERKGKMYLDFLQNRPGATIAGPYSLRPKPGATVSMPLSWDEVKPGLNMKDFTIRNAMERLRSTGDLFHGVLGPGINLEATIKKAEGLF